MTTSTPKKKQFFGLIFKSFRGHYSERKPYQKLNFEFVGIVKRNLMEPMKETEL